MGISRTGQWNYIVCTSATHPNPPTTGMLIFETDTNLQLIYNGSAWVCITPQSAIVEAGETTTSTSFADLTTAGPSVSVQTGTKALVTTSGPSEAVARMLPGSLAPQHLAGATRGRPKFLCQAPARSGLCDSLIRQRLRVL